MADNWPQDIEGIIIDRLQDATYGLRSQITTINTTRSQSTPLVLDANISSERKDENPEVIIDYESSNIESYFGDTDCSNLRKDCNVTVIAFLSSAETDNLKKWASNYVEAITKCLHSYSYSNVTVALATEDIIDNLYQEQIDTTKFAGVRFSVKINGGI